MKMASFLCFTIFLFRLAKLFLAALFYRMNLRSALIKAVNVFWYPVKLGTYFFSYTAKPTKPNMFLLEVGFLYSIIAEMSLFGVVSPLFPVV
jgi:hypothetical protein